MSDPISHIKSSGGQVDTEFVDQSSYGRLDAIEFSIRNNNDNLVNTTHIHHDRIWSIVSKDYFASGGMQSLDPVEVSPGDKFYVTAYSYGGGLPCCVFFDGNPDRTTYKGHALLNADGEQYVNAIVTIPAGCTQVIFQTSTKSTQQFSVVRAEIIDVSGELDELQLQDITYYESIGGITWNQGCWSVVTGGIFDNYNWKYAVINPSDLSDMKTLGASGATNSSVPLIVLLSGTELVNDNVIAKYGQGTSGDITVPSEVYGVEIPSNCKAIVISTASQHFPTFVGNRVQTHTWPSIDGRASMVRYSLSSTDLDVRHPYGNGEMSVIFGKRGPNSLPDFKYINNGSKNLYSNATDWHGPFIVAADANADGDQPDHRYFTGGNHNYNNAGGMDASATARNLSLKFFADGGEIADGDTGFASVIEIVWVNRVQAYNTTKANGAGREVLEERHRLTFDGTEWKSYVEIEPLEDVHMQTYYGFQATSDTGNWPIVQFIGGANRKKFTITDYVQSAPDSAGRRSNKLVAHSDTDLLEIEVDRSFDMGAGTAVQPTTHGWRTANNKLYSYLVDDKDMSAGDVYGAVGYWRFRPVTHEGV